MKSQTSSPILKVTDKELADQLKMKSGNFYCYYKPSYINGYGQYQNQDIDFPYLQAFEGVCRDEFTPNSNFILSDEFKDELALTNGIQNFDFS
jgi:hypothetical protein